MARDLSSELREKIKLFLRDELSEPVIENHEEKMGYEEALEKVKRDLNKDLMLPEAEEYADKKLKKIKKK